MPDAKVTGLGSLTGANVANGDAVMIVDVSDMTMAGTGTNKRITADELAQMPQLSSRYAPQSGDQIFVAATAMTAFSGAPAVGTAQNITGLLLDSASAEYVGGGVYIPSWWTTYNVNVVWTQTAGGSGDVRWQFFRRSLADGQTLAASGFSSATGTAPANDVVEHTQMVAGTTSALGAPMGFYIGRLAADAADTLPNDCLLLGVLFTRAS